MSSNTRTGLGGLLRTTATVSEIGGHPEEAAGSGLGDRGLHESHF
jgi:hypothetical protein